MKIPAGSVALVTGANRGLGRHFAQQLLQRGGATVYATTRSKVLHPVAGCTVRAGAKGDPGGARWPFRRV